ncbi:MAG: CPBP family intramembrane metalloprotease [Phycisphaerae bacterium]|nr:CPBP family intramembrane metalloprotease [Phycisphaerae bacterium]
MSVRRTESARRRRPQGGDGAPSLLGSVGRTSADYWVLSSRPLHSLLLLLPLVGLYELGSWLWLRDAGARTLQTIRAKRLLAEFCETFGVGGLVLPGLILLVVLLIMHVLSRDPWRVRPMVLATMVVEAFAWTLPLLVLGGMMQRAGALAATDAEGSILALSWPARATLALGAGLYEELLFRMIGLALVHLILADVLGTPERWARVLSVAVSALAFSLYHDVSLPGGGANVALVVFYMAAGVYFGIVYLMRGFGVVAATHAVYDLLVLVLLRG